MGGGGAQRAGERLLPVCSVKFGRDMRGDHHVARAGDTPRQAIENGRQPVHGAAALIMQANQLESLCLVQREGFESKTGSGQGRCALNPRGLIYGRRKFDAGLDDCFAVLLRADPEKREDRAVESTPPV